MGEFKGGRAAIQSIQFIFNHFSAFLKLTATWAAISTAIVFAYCLIAQPGGPDASLGAHLNALDGARDRTKQLVSLLPDIFGSLAVSVIWIRFVLLDQEPRNPLKLSGEMGTYLVRNIQVSFLSFAAAIPAAIVAVALGSVLGRPFGYIGAGIAGVIGIVSVLVIYGRLLIVLPSVAVNEDIKAGDAFDYTKGRSTTLAAGLFVSYLIPLAALAILLAVIGGALTVFSPSTAPIFVEIATNLGTYMALGIVAGYMALAYRAIVPGDTGDKLAAVFE